MVEVTHDHLSAPAGPADRGVPAHFLRPQTDGAVSLGLLLGNVDCPSCIQKIETALGSQPGVLSARVNFSTRRLAVSLDPRTTSAEAVIETLGSRGYQAVPYDPDQLGESERGADRALLRALAVSGFAAANVMLLSVSVWSGLNGDMGEATRMLFHWLSALIALPAIAYAGRPFFQPALAALRHGAMNMDVPISLAVVLAAAMSLYQTMNGGHLVYFEAALMLLFFLLIGRFLDQRLRHKARSAVQHLIGLRALTATVVDGAGRQQHLPVQAVPTGARVLVASGERIPVDGRIALGTSEVDSSLVTGESLPQRVTEGSAVYAGTLNLGSALEITVETSHDGTLLAEIVRLIEAAEQGRARYVRLADRLARLYAPAVHILAGATVLGWLALSDAGWEVALLNAIAVLIITCPCALGLAVPAVQVVASGALLRKGLLMKSADGLEKLADIDTVVFDKTGTLTLGRLELVDRSEIDPDALARAASLAGASRHPLCRAITRAAGPVALAEGVRERAGMGLEAEIDGLKVRLGNRRWCAVPDPEEPDNDEAGSDEGPELWLAVAGRPAVRFSFLDQPRPDARATIDWLKGRGLSVELISGDRPGPVAKVAGELGIADWRALARPDDKISRLEALQAAGRRCLMVGDGLNDAPALAAAQVSISPASGADVSQASADLIFQGDRLAAVRHAIVIARTARRLVMQNFGLALVYNLIAVPIAVAGFVTPLIAALAMSGSSILVTLNALRLGITRKPTPGTQPGTPAELQTP